MSEAFGLPMTAGADLVAAGRAVGGLVWASSVCGSCIWRICAMEFLIHYRVRECSGYL